MARTYRRRHAPHERAWALTDYTVVRAPNGRYIVQRFTLNPHSPEGRKTLARFHADNYFMHNTPPVWFRRIHHHRDRQRLQQGLYRWWHRNDHDELLCSQHRHSAQWEWN